MRALVGVTINAEVAALLFAALITPLANQSDVGEPQQVALAPQIRLEEIE
jgi:hypothetical protein